MNPIIFALRRPITVMVGIIAVLLTALVAVRPKAFDAALRKVGIELPLTRMPIDIFPSLNLPVIYVCQPYGGMDPAQMEGLLTNYYEYHFLYINGIHHVESRNVQGTALMKLMFHPGTNMAQAMVKDIRELGNIPIKVGVGGGSTGGASAIGSASTVYLRDIGVIEDAADVTTGYSLVNGRRAVYILATKRADASTMSVIDEIKAAMPKFRAEVPSDINVSFEFDQSPYVTRAINSLAAEGTLGAILTGLMVLVFLRDWRSATGGARLSLCSTSRWRSPLRLSACGCAARPST